MFTTKSLQENDYSWLQNSGLYAIIDTNIEEEILYIHCKKDEKDIFLYLQVMQFWDVFHRPHEFFELYYNEVVLNASNKKNSIINKIKELNCTINSDFYNFLLLFENYDVEKIFCGAAFYGFIDYFEYMKDTETYQGMLSIWNICVNASESNKIECLKYLYENNFTFTNEVFSIALLNGNLESAKFAYENGCKIKMSDMNWTLEGGNIECVKFLLEKDLKFDQRSLEICAGKKDKKLLEFVIANYKTSDQKGDTTCIYAALKGSIECLKFAHENGYPLDDSHICNLSAKIGSLDCLRYAHENGCKLQLQTLFNSVEESKMECLKYCHENGCEFPKSAIQIAVKKNKINFVKYLHENGCPWDEEVFNDSIISGNLLCMKYLHENGCPYDGNIRTLAEENRKLNCLKYIEEVIEKKET